MTEEAEEPGADPEFELFREAVWGDEGTRDGANVDEGVETNEEVREESEFGEFNS